MDEKTVMNFVFQFMEDHGKEQMLQMSANDMYDLIESELGNQLGPWRRNITDFVKCEAENWTPYTEEDMWSSDDIKSYDNLMMLKQRCVSPLFF